jgi:hypothetical protein
MLRPAGRERAERRSLKNPEGMGSVLCIELLLITPSTGWAGSVYGLRGRAHLCFGPVASVVSVSFSNSWQTLMKLPDEAEKIALRPVKRAGLPKTPRRFGRKRIRWAAATPSRGGLLSFLLAGWPL